MPEEAVWSMENAGKWWDSGARNLMRSKYEEDGWSITMLAIDEKRSFGAILAQLVSVRTNLRPDDKAMYDKLYARFSPSQSYGERNNVPRSEGRALL